jgi:hypothetical protein
MVAVVLAGERSFYATGQVDCRSLPAHPARGRSPQGLLWQVHHRAFVAL